MKQWTRPTFYNFKLKSTTQNARQQLQRTIELLQIQRYMKVHKMSKRMVHVLSNLNTVMCHVFIKNQVMMPPNNAHDFSTNLEDDLLKK